MGLRDAIVRQFGRPEGLAGRLVGLIMTVRASNRERSRRTVELLQIQPEDRVLEIGYGPGLAIQWAAERAVRGKVVGVDHSALMRRTAARRNARAIEAGRVELHAAAVAAMPSFPAPFDKVLAVNVYLFWPDPVAVLTALSSVMRPGGTIALTFQPRNRGATSADARRGGERIADSLRSAGFRDVRVEVLPLRPVEAVCVLGRAPDRDRPGGREIPREGSARARTAEATPSGATSAAGRPSGEPTS